MSSKGHFEQWCSGDFLSSFSCVDVVLSTVWWAAGVPGDNATLPARVREQRSEQDQSEPHHPVGERGVQQQLTVAHVQGHVALVTVCCHRGLLGASVLQVSSICNSASNSYQAQNPWVKR